MYRGLKSEFLAYYGVEDGTMHFVLGAAFFAVTYAATRRPWLSLMLLYAIQFGNEYLDAAEQMALGPVDLHQAARDTAFTVALPSAAAAVLATIHAVAAALPR